MEDVVFDKASRAEEIETERDRLNDDLVELEGRLAEASEQERPSIERMVERNRAGLAQLDEEAAALAAEDDGGA